MSEHRQQIIEAAVAMGAHYRAGNMDRAAEYADEIEEAQRADREKDGNLRWLATCRQPGIAPEGREVWSLTLDRWANDLMMAWRKGRYFYPRAGCTEGEALAEARRVHHPIFPGRLLGCDEIEPVYPAERRAA